MSRTVHHVPQRRWNRRELYAWARLERDEAGAGAEFWPRTHAVGHVLFDLRFPAGCRRVPQLLRHEVVGGGYLHGHGGNSAIQWGAREIEGGLRAAARAFAVEAVKAHRAGADLDELCEPEGRTRHGAIWDYL